MAFNFLWDNIFVADDKLAVSKALCLELFLTKQGIFFFSVQQHQWCAQHGYNGMTPLSDSVCHLYSNASLVTTVWSCRPTCGCLSAPWMKTKSYRFRNNLSPQPDSLRYMDVVGKIPVVVEMKWEYNKYRSFLCWKQYFSVSETSEFFTLLLCDLFTLNVTQSFKNYINSGESCSYRYKRY